MYHHIERTAEEAGLRFTPTADATVIDDLKRSLSTNALEMAGRFLQGDASLNLLAAHNTVKAIHACGQERFPTLWEKVGLYVRTAEFHMLERLAALPGVHRAHSFNINSLALHNRTNTYVKVHSLQRGYIHFRNGVVDASAHCDHWHKYLQAI